jgi:hypothetical protein
VYQSHHSESKDKGLACSQGQADEVANFVALEGFGFVI